MGALNIGRIILLMFIYIVALPLIIYYTYQFYQNKSSKTVLFRQPFLIVCLNSLVIASFTIDRTTRYIAAIIGFNLPTWITSLLSGSTAYGIINLLAVKSYLLLFQHRYHTAIQNKTWAQEINHGWDNWYIRNRNKWGNFHYILKWLIIPYCMQASLTAFGEMIWGFTANIMLQAIFATTPILILLICGIKLGYFYDSFGIRREVLMQFLMFIVAIPIYFSIVLGLRSHLSHNVYNILVEMSQGILIITLFTLLAVSSAYYPLHLIKYKNRHGILLPESNASITMARLLECFTDYQMFSFFMNHLVKEFATESALFVVEWCQIKNNYQNYQNGVIKISNKTKTTSENDSDIRQPYMTIDFNQNMDSIIPPLPKAISLSNSSRSCTSKEDMLPDMILSAKSFSKSKSKIYLGVITTYLIEDGHFENMIKIQISKQIPESDILQQYPNDIKLQVKALYNKYITEDCEHQINIPFTLKHPATKLISKLETENQSDAELEFCEGDLWCSMDRICLNVLGLLLNPYSRFKIGEEYIEYVNSAEYKSFVKELEMMEWNDNEGPKVFEGSMYDQVCNKYKL